MNTFAPYYILCMVFFYERGPIVAREDLSGGYHPGGDHPFGRMQEEISGHDRFQQ